MKTLYVIRHAKSSWDDPDLSDFDRPLNKRGKNDAPRMGKRLKEKHILPDCVISSPARRAHSTAKRICKVLGFEKDKIKTDRRLYHATEDAILSVIQGIKHGCNIAMVYGHNPGLTDFVNALMDEETGRYIHNIPTCGVAGFVFDVNDWADVDWKKGRLELYDYPKNREDQG